MIINQSDAVLFGINENDEVFTYAQKPKDNFSNILGIWIKSAIYVNEADAKEDKVGVRMQSAFSAASFNITIKEGDDGFELTF